MTKRANFSPFMPEALRFAACLTVGDGHLVLDQMKQRLLVLAADLAIPLRPRS